MPIGTRTHQRERRTSVCPADRFYEQPHGSAVFQDLSGKRSGASRQRLASFSSNGQAAGFSTLAVLSHCRSRALDCSRGAELVERAKHPIVAIPKESPG